MSGGYQGQPDYVRAGFLKDIFEPWCSVARDDEWGEYVSALWEAADRGISVSAHDNVLVIVGWLRASLESAFDQEWWGNEDEYLPVILEARGQYERIVAYWRERAVSFRGETALEEAIAGLPSWIRPSEDLREQLRNQVTLLEGQLSEINANRQRVATQLEVVQRRLESDTTESP